MSSHLTTAARKILALLRKVLKCSVLLFFLLGVASCIISLFELGITLFTLSLVATFVLYSLRRENPISSLLFYGFLAGYILSWCIGFLGYCYIIPLRGINPDLPREHTVVTAVLVLVAIAASCLGAVASMKILPATARFEIGDCAAFRKILPFLAVFGVCNIVYLVLVFRSFGLNARWTIGNDLAVGSIYYVLGGLRAIAYPFYVMLGIAMNRHLLSLRNCLILVILAGIVFVMAMTGGREQALEPIVFWGLGALFSPISLQKLMRLAIIAVPVISCLIVFIGLMRDAPGFSDGNVADKMRAAEMVLHEKAAPNSPNADPYSVLFTRLFESTAQRVIDDVTDGKEHAGWMNCDRLFWLFIPKYLHVDKRALDDGNERLVEYFGYKSDEFSTSPITLIADAYDRFGTLGVFIFHFFSGFCLVFLGRLVFIVKHPILVIILMACFTKLSIRLYPVSNLGFFQATFYAFTRDALIIGLFFSVGIIVSRRLGRKRMLQEG